MTAEDIRDIKLACERHRKELSERMNEGAKKFTEHDGRIKHLEAFREEQSQHFQTLNDKLTAMSLTLTDLRLEIATGRPSWIIVALISVLFSTCAGMAVYIIYL